MSDNPFAEPDDVDRTIVRPMPGGRTSQAQPPPPPIAPRPTRPVQLEDVGPAPIETIASGVSPLAAAAAPLLQLLARLRNVARPPDPGELRQRALNAVRAFERKATESGVPAEELRLANFVLCASVDDVVMNTPWGSTGVWEAHSLVAAFHGKVDAGERFFSLLTKLREFPAKNLQILELMYLCLSLGFMGRYRLSPRGPAEIDRLREETYSVIVRNRAPAELELSPHWQGVAAPYRAKRGTIPIWAAGATALTIVAALFGWSSFRLADTSDQLYQKMISAPPDHMPAIARAAPVQPPIEPPPVEPTALDRLRGFLQPEIDEGLVTVLGTQSTPIVRISNKGMFLSGSASVQPQFTSLLQRIGSELKDEPGSVLVIGYTDNQPIHTVKFPSNYELSAARAQAAGEIIARTIDDPGRISAEGRAEANPIASNASSEGREQNRRIEIILRRPT